MKENVEQTEELFTRTLYKIVQDYYYEKSIKVPDQWKAEKGISNLPIILYEAFLSDFPETDLARSTFYNYKPT